MQCLAAKSVNINSKANTETGKESNMAELQVHAVHVSGTSDKSVYHWTQYNWKATIGGKFEATRTQPFHARPNKNI